MYSVGLDVGERCSSVEILDSHGKHLQASGGQRPLAGVVGDESSGSVPRPFAVCFEASCGYGYLHERLSTAWPSGSRCCGTRDSCG